MLKIQEENDSDNKFSQSNKFINFNFNKEISNKKLLSHNRQFGKNIKNNFNEINKNFHHLNIKKQYKAGEAIIFSTVCKENANKDTKPKIEKEISYKKKKNFLFPLFDLNTLIPTNSNNININNQIEIKKIFNINEKEVLPFEISYLLDAPNFNYDFLHQNDNNSNYEYNNENFIDILLNSCKNQMSLNKNILPLNNIQTEINYQKRNILVSWITETNFKYIKSQNVLFMAVKLIDRILYKKQINIKEFQLIGILCLNLTLKIENHYKVFYIDEIIDLLGYKEKNRKKIENSDKIKILTKQIIKKENEICKELSFDFETSSPVLILDRLIQIINIQNNSHFKLFQSIAYFFLELSLYNEDFYEIDDFSKALSSLLMTKKVLKKKGIETGFHNYLVTCTRIKRDELKKYCEYSTETIKILKNNKYGNTIFIKYNDKDFNQVMDNYIKNFIIED